MYKHLINTPDEAITFLVEANADITIRPFAKFNLQVLGDANWMKVPASIGHHGCAAHRAEGGLVVHTAQVASTMWDMLKNIRELDEEWMHAWALTAAIWHDFAKVYEYKANAEGVFEKTEYYKEIGHVVGSYLEFTKAADAWNAEAEAELTGGAVPQKSMIMPVSIREIQHAILAHHGRMEWGSPKEPQNALAWALHAADMMSAHFCF